MNKADIISDLNNLDKLKQYRKELNDRVENLKEKFKLTDYTPDYTIGCFNEIKRTIKNLNDIFGEL
jgi:uncharacterized protein YhaN